MLNVCSLGHSFSCCTVCVASPLFTLEYRKSKAVPAVKQVAVPDAISDADSVLGGGGGASSDAADDAAMSREAINAAVRQVGVREPRLPRWKQQQKKLSAQALDDAVAQAEATVKAAPWALKAVKPTTAAPITESDDEPMAAGPTLSPIERAVAEARAVVRTPGAKRALALAAAAADADADADAEASRPQKKRKGKAARAQKKRKGKAARAQKKRTGKQSKRVRSSQKKNKTQPAQWNFGPDNGKKTIPRVARYFREKRERAAAKERARILATPEGWMRDRMQKARARHG